MSSSSLYLFSFAYSSARTQLWRTLLRNGNERGLAEVDEAAHMKYESSNGASEDAERRGRGS
jgi:hypothetical protein